MLIAYFVSQGNNRHPVYRKPKSNKKLDIELISAVYGAPGDPKKQMDVSHIIKQYLNARDYDFAMTNTVAGRDPAGGVIKVLLLKYKLNGKIIEKKVPENGRVPFSE